MKPTIARMIALSLAAAFACCGRFGDKKTDRPAKTAPAEQAVPAAQQQAPPSDWARAVSHNRYRVETSAIEQSQGSSYADRIGTGQIEQLKMAGPSSAPKIAAFLTSRSRPVRDKAVEVLGSFGVQAESALPKVLEILRHTEPQVRLSAAQALAGIGSGKANDPLEDALEDSNPAVRAWAHAALVRAGDDCPEHQRATAQLLRDNPGPSSTEAARAMSLMGCADPEAIDLLIEATERNAEMIRAAAARALGQIGQPAARAVPRLIGLLDAKLSARVKLAALLALAQMGPRATPAVAILIAYLSDPAPRFRQLAAHALGEIGPAATDAVGPLRKATLDSEPSVQAASKKALARILSGGEKKP